MPTEISGSTGVNKIQDNTIVNADINSSAAIAGSKISGSFGKVLQVVQATYRTEVSTTSTSSWVSTGLSASITPSSTSSKVLVRYTMPHYNDTASRYVYSTIFRGTVSGTNLAPGSEGIGVSRISNESVLGTVPGEWLDSPNTTSSQTYTIGHKVNGGTGTAQINGTNSTITLMEIGA